MFHPKSVFAPGKKNALISDPKFSAPNRYLPSANNLSPEKSATISNKTLKLLHRIVSPKSWRRRTLNQKLSSSSWLASAPLSFRRNNRKLAARHKSVWKKHFKISHPGRTVGFSKISPVPKELSTNPFLSAPLRVLLRLCVSPLPVYASFDPVPTPDATSCSLITASTSGCTVGFPIPRTNSHVAHVDENDR